MKVNISRQMGSSWFFICHYGYLPRKEVAAVKGRPMAKRKIVLAIIMILAALLPSAGCGKKSTVVQGVFTRDGIALVGATTAGESPREVSLRVNDQPKAASWQKSGRFILLREPWQAGTSYEVSVDGKSWRGIAPLNPASLAVNAEELGSLEETPSVKEWTPAVYEDVAVSPDGKYIGVASFDHNVYLYDDKGQKLWQNRIANGVGVAVAFVADGSRLFVGESSPDANIYAFDISSGKIVWQYSFAADIGSSSAPRWNQRPKITGIVAAGGRVVASAEYTQRVTEKDGARTKVKYVTACVVKAFDIKNGDVVWRYPQTGAMDTGVSRMTASADGGKLVFANHSWSKGREYVDGALRILNGATGKLIGLHQLTPKRFSYVGLFDGVHLSPNGNYLAVITADSRGMLFDVSGVTDEGVDHVSEFRLLWLRQISKIHQVGGVPVYAYGNTARTTDDGRVFFMTGGTFLADKTASTGAPPIVHPDATSLFAYSADGGLLWKWQTEGGISKLRFSCDSRYLILPVYHNYVTGQNDRAGLYCLDLAKSDGDPLVWFYQFEGVAAAAAIAGDGTAIAGLEVPLRQADDRPVGRHRLHILR